ncbi:MAG: glycoside hydrolase family 9 protein [Nibricoccus sp.]
MTTFGISLRGLFISAACGIASPSIGWAQADGVEAQLRLNEAEYLEMPGLNVMLAHDFYPEGHQGGVGIIQNGVRVATNGDVRLEPTPGQWQATPKVGTRQVDRSQQEVNVRMSYPNPEKNRKSFNPINYPDLKLSYIVRIRPEGAGFRVIVDLDEALPANWVGKVGFNLELFPGALFGKPYYLDSQAGIFPRQPNGPGRVRPELDDPEDELSTGYQLEPLAVGSRLVVAPDSETQRLVIESVQGGPLELRDGRDQHNNGWFVVRSIIPAGATRSAVEWFVKPSVVPGWKSAPVVQVSQVGYKPNQSKTVVVELDRRETALQPLKLFRVSERGAPEAVETSAAVEWGTFLRYRYLRLDFSAVQKPGLYFVQYGGVRSAVFRIAEDVFSRAVWQPTLEYFLPIQMCHMRVNDRYRVWHNWCHLDDARMAPTNYNHFDGYIQGSATLTNYKSGDHVPELDRGGWHDAGDDDLRIESQAETIHGLALAYELFKADYDNTTIDQENRVVELHHPDGKPDLLQQIEHGALSIVGGYKSMGRLYRGIIVPTKRQYVHLGEFGSVTDNKAFAPGNAIAGKGAVIQQGGPDDRWVFTEDNPHRELQVAGCLAAAARPLRQINPSLAEKCLEIAEELWRKTREKDAVDRLLPAAELLISTKKQEYADFLVKHAELAGADFARTGWVLGRTLALVEDSAYRDVLKRSASTLRTAIETKAATTPYGVPYEPAIWGAGWGIQRFGVQQVYLHEAFPDVFPASYFLKALDFVLGCHPGSNTASFVSGVGARSLLPGYGFNRADWSYLPGGVGSGTALIRPDFPELLEWPYLWQQTEYVLGYGTTDFITLVLAADRIGRQ